MARELIRFNMNDAAGEPAAIQFEIGAFPGYRNDETIMRDPIVPDESTMLGVNPADLWTADTPLELMDAYATLRALRGAYTDPFLLALARQLAARLTLALQHGAWLHEHGGQA